MSETRSEMTRRWATMTDSELADEWSARHARLTAKYNALTDEQKARIPVAGEPDVEPESVEECGMGLNGLACSFPLGHVSAAHSWETHLLDPELAEWLDGAPVFAQHEQLVREDVADYAERAQS